jgi:hypothetical protein
MARDPLTASSNGHSNDIKCRMRVMLAFDIVDPDRPLENLSPRIPNVSEEACVYITSSSGT